MRINPKQFLVQHFETFHPLSNHYLSYWKEQKRRAIEGYWASGRWMPGKLYFYSNMATILLNKKGAKVKSYGRPLLQDLEWEFFNLWDEARGFSGFVDDPDYTCFRPMTREGITDDELRRLSPDDGKYIFKPNGERKKYIPAREYMRKIHPHNLGRPLYQNEAKNFMMMGPRGFGKSYSVGSGIVAHEWLMDGANHYSEEFIENPSASTTIVGAGDAKYSNDLLSKTKVTIDMLPGAQEINGVYYPSPLAKQWKGSFTPGREVKAEYQVKMGGNWITKGSGSVIRNRTFKDNPYAVQGSRAGVIVYEEIGMFNNLRSSYSHSVDVMKDGSYKFGSAMFLGTGGDMEAGTIDAYQMFYNPEQYDLLTFEDIWEHKNKIAYFVPATMGDRAFKDDWGYTMHDKALEFKLAERKKLAGEKGGSATLDAHIVYHPLVPSEVFLVSSNNVFPVAELMKRKEQLMRDKVTQLHEKRVELFFNKDAKKTNGVDYRIDVEGRLKAIREFPISNDLKDREGAVVIYEFPEIDKDTGKVPNDMYIIGHDPFATDNPDGPSLASIYVLKTKKYKYKYGHDEIVAQYVGRPKMGRRVVNDILMKLSMFYGNAKIYFENVRGNVKEYFEKHKKLSLLATQPKTVLTKKASFQQTSASLVYGYPMSGKKEKQDALLYTVDWLLEQRGETRDGTIIRNLDLIPDPGLLDEMINFNMEGNFDRVMGFLGCIIGLEETYNQYEELQLESAKGNKFDFLANNKALFPSASPISTFQL